MHPILAQAISFYPGLIGFIIPIIAQAINRKVVDWNVGKFIIPSRYIKFLVAVGVCLVLAALMNWNSLVFGSTEAVKATFLMLFAESQFFYQMFFKKEFEQSTLLRPVVIS